MRKKQPWALITGYTVDGIELLFFADGGRLQMAVVDPDGIGQEKETGLDAADARVAIASEKTGAPDGAGTDQERSPEEFRDAFRIVSFPCRI